MQNLYLQKKKKFFCFLPKKFRTQWSVKKMMLTVFWDMKGPIISDFLEKGTTVNSAFVCLLLRQHSPYLLNDPSLIYKKNLPLIPIVVFVFCFYIFTIHISGI